MLVHHNLCYWQSHRQKSTQTSTERKVPSTSVGKEGIQCTTSGTRPAHSPRRPKAGYGTPFHARCSYNHAFDFLPSMYPLGLSSCCHTSENHQVIMLNLSLCLGGFPLDPLLRRLYGTW
mmetsp:Transcript_79302/g.139934  ORF Transcript_79302/g.139934 Transcript_79302/m.139934 type:complete len:119 (-) Transcript_79302:1587-1943(-)